MAPLALANISEEISQSHHRHQGGQTLEECMTKAYAASAGGFCLGFSAGIATQVHYAQLLPRAVRAVFLLPIALGMFTSTTVFRHSSANCVKEWNASHRTFPVEGEPSANGVVISN